MIEEFNRKAQIVRRFMEYQRMDFLVVGSGALLMCGMPLYREPHDVDIEVICTKEQGQILRSLDAASNIKRNEYFIHPLIFKIEDVLVNAWVVKEFTHKYPVRYDGIKYAPVYSVLQKKLSYNRPKDILDLHKMIEKLINLE